jgi:hypothetical protein
LVDNEVTKEEAEDSGLAGGGSGRQARRRWLRRAIAAQSPLRQLDGEEEQRTWRRIDLLYDGLMERESSGGCLTSMGSSGCALGLNLLCEISGCAPRRHCYSMGLGPDLELRVVDVLQVAAGTREEEGGNGNVGGGGCRCLVGCGLWISA